MASYGLNFRGSSAYVTDGANETYEIGSPYPTTHGGLTFGWVSGAGPVNGGIRDRLNTNDRRLAGIAYIGGGSSGDFRIDLPATGSWDIRLALGDASNADPSQQVVLKDNTTTFATINGATSVANNFRDALNVEYSAAAWPGSNSLLTRVFASTTFILTLNGAGTSPLAHVNIANSATGATAVTMTGPSSGTVSVASSNFTVGANGTITGTVIVTPSDSAGGGTFTPTTVSISSGTPTGTFTYTPASVGAKTISVTNNGALTNPANITYTATAAGSRIFLPNWGLSGLGSGGPFFQNPLQ